MSATNAPRPVSAAEYAFLHDPFVPRPPAESYRLQVYWLRFFGFDLPHDEVERLAKYVPQDHRLFILSPAKPDWADFKKPEFDAFVSRIEVDGKRGENDLEPEGMSDTVYTPKRPHLLLGVQDGRERKEMTPYLASEEITSEGRIPFNAWYGLILLILFSHVLKSHNLSLAGSRFDKIHVPHFYLHRGVPRQNGQHPNTLMEGWKVPSAASRAGVIV